MKNTRLLAQMWEHNGYVTDVVSHARIPHLQGGRILSPIANPSSTALTAQHLEDNWQIISLIAIFGSTELPNISPPKLKYQFIIDTINIKNEELIVTYVSSPKEHQVPCWYQLN